MLPLKRSALCKRLTCLTVTLDIYTVNNLSTNIDNKYCQNSQLRLKFTYVYFKVLYHLQELDGDVENFAVQTVNGKGVVRLTNRLDYERKSLYQLRVLAVDRANQGRVNTGTAAILVKVQDVEDQPPEFVVASPVTRISEDAPVGTSVLQGKKCCYFV